jgi:hypothetical protein
MLSEDPSQFSLSVNPDVQRDAVAFCLVDVNVDCVDTRGLESYGHALVRNADYNWPPGFWTIEHN